MDDKWALVTTYKVSDPPEVNFRLMETHVNFYRKKWNVEKEILLIGLPRELLQKNNDIAEGILDRIIKINQNESYTPKKYGSTFGGKKFDHISNVCYYKSMFTDIIIYETSLSTPTSEWSTVKQILFQICDLELDSSYNKIVNIDSDEFIYLPHSQKPKDFEEFHYIEHVPSSNLNVNFNVEKDMKWCLQGWYYRLLFKNQHRDIKQAYEPKHGACKKFYFNRNRSLSPQWEPWIHTGKTPISHACRNVTKDNYKEFNIGYHLACLDYDNYRYGKSQMFKRCGASEMFKTPQAEDIFRSSDEKLKHSYLNHYAMSELYMEYFNERTVVDNTIKDYWRGN